MHINYLPILFYFPWKHVSLLLAGRGSYNGVHRVYMFTSTLAEKVGKCCFKAGNSLYDTIINYCHLSLWGCFDVLFLLPYRSGSRKWQNSPRAGTRKLLLTPVRSNYLEKKISALLSTILQVLNQTPFSHTTASWRGPHGAVSKQE